MNTLTATYTPAEELASRVQLTVMRYQQAGGHVCDGHRPSAAEVRLKTEMKALLPQVERLMQEGTVADYVRLQSVWNVLYMDVRGVYPSFEIRYKHSTDAISRWIRGDKSASSESLMEIIFPLQRENLLGIDSKLTDWYFRNLEKWTNELQFTVRPLRYDAETLYRRLHILLDDSLDTYVNSPQATKTAWVKKYAAPDLSVMSLEGLFAYERFLESARPFLTAGRYDELKSALSEAISSHSGLHPDLKEAIVLSDTYMQECRTKPKVVKISVRKKHERKAENGKSFQIPAATSIRYTDGTEVRAYGHLLAVYLRTHHQGKSKGEIECTDPQCLQNIYHWLDEVEAHLLAIPESQLLDAIKYYGEFHLYATCSRVPDSFYEKVYTRILAALQRKGSKFGKGKINEGEFYIALTSWLKESNRIGMSKFTEWTNAKLKEWHGQALGYYTSPEATSPETIAKVTALLSSDLSSVETDQKLFKRLIALRYSQLFDELDRHSGQTLEALLSLLHTCSDHFPDLPIPDTARALRSRLAWSPSLHPVLSDSYRQSLLL